MRADTLIGFAAASLVAGLTAGCAGPVRHAPDAHMNQDAEQYTYDYDDGLCTYHYQYDFRTLKDNLDQTGDCRNVPVERYHPQAAISATYPSPGAAPPMIAPTTTAQQGVPSVDVGRPAPVPGSPPGAPPPVPAELPAGAPPPPPRAPAGITVAPAP
jgi:hypothetical protein